VHEAHADSWRQRSCSLFPQCGALLAAGPTANVSAGRMTPFNAYPNYRVLKGSFVELQHSL